MNDNTWIELQLFNQYLINVNFGIVIVIIIYEDLSFSWMFILW